MNGLGSPESTLALQQFLDHDSEMEGDRLPVGLPVPGTEVLLLDDEGRETELSGEIALRGRHLALEY